MNAKIIYYSGQDESVDIRKCVEGKSKSGICLYLNAAMLITYLYEAAVNSEVTKTIFAGNYLGVMHMNYNWISILGYVDNFFYKKLSSIYNLKRISNHIAYALLNVCRA